MTTAGPGDSQRPSPENKVAPDALDLRAHPRPVTRINRKVLIAAAAVVLLVIAALVLVALRAPSLRIAAPNELFNVEHKPITDALSKLPESYDGVQPDKKAHTGKHPRPAGVDPGHHQPRRPAPDRAAAQRAANHHSAPRLWAAPWLTDVEELQRPVVVTHLFVMALALSASALLLGIGADRLRRRGTPLPATFAITTGAAIVAQLALVLRWPVPVWLPWVTIAATGAGTVLSYAILSEMFPKSASGRANGALNLLHVTAAFAIQYAIGLVVQQWPAEAGHYPPEAYQTALGLNLVVQAAAFLWFVRPERKTALEHLPAHPIHALAASLGLAPAAALSYARARHAWALQLARARAQHYEWRTAAFASFAVLALLSAALGSTVLGAPVAAHVLNATHGSEPRDFAHEPAWPFKQSVMRDRAAEVLSASVPLWGLHGRSKEGS